MDCEKRVRKEKGCGGEKFGGNFKGTVSFLSYVGFVLVIKGPFFRL